MPAATLRIMPARSMNRWLTVSASPGSSRSVGMSVSETRMWGLWGNQSLDVVPEGKIMMPTNSTNPTCCASSRCRSSRFSSNRLNKEKQ